MRKALILASMMTSTLPGCALFAGGAPVVTTQSAGCSSLIPPDWAQGVESAPLPGGSTVGDWITFGDQQTGRLDQANDRTASTIHIVTACEARDVAAVHRATRRRFLGIF